MVKLTGAFIKVDDCYIAFIKEEPGAITEGKTIEEAAKNLLDAYNQLQIARQNRQERKDASDRKVIEYEAELEKSYDVIHRDISIEIPA
jgi:hypothetical protein